MYLTYWIHWWKFWVQTEGTNTLHLWKTSKGRISPTTSKFCKAKTLAAIFIAVSSHTIRGMNGIFTYKWLIFMVNVGNTVSIPYMDGVGMFFLFGLVWWVCACVCSF